MPRRFILPVCCLAAIALLSGCAAVKTSILDRPLGNMAAMGARGLPWLAAADSGNDSQKLGACIEAARVSLPGSLEGDPQENEVYRAAIRRIVELLGKNNWNLSPAAGSPSLVIAGADRTNLDPRQPERLIPADQIRIRGLRNRSQQDGLGLPYVAWLPHDAPSLADEPGVPPAGMAIPVTALIVFDGNRQGTLRFVRTLPGDTVEVNGRPRRLAADFSAPTGVIISKGMNRQFDLFALFAPLKHMSRSGLYQLQPYEPSKIPVVFVHGLLTRPETWQQTLNEMMTDPGIRRNYQFWFFHYPSGLPVWKTAAIMRSELDRFNTALTPRTTSAADRRRLDGKILIGHSMGGLVSSLQIRHGGPELTRQFTQTPMEDLPISESARKALREMVDFSPRTDVARVVFVAVPHRGSPLALHPGSGFLARRIRFALPELGQYRDLLLGHFHHELRRDLAVPMNSIRFLRANSPFVLTTLKLPRDESIPVHSIIGDRGRGDAPAGGDGVVPYWSAHFPGAVSEKIVPTGHDAHEHPAGIKEMKRILREHLGEN